MLELRGIKKVYGTCGQSVEALRGVDIEFRKCEFVSVLGQSGCGKTTLLNIIGGLDKYTSGDLIIRGRSTKKILRQRMGCVQKPLGRICVSEL